MLPLNEQVCLDLSLGAIPFLSTRRARSISERDNCRWGFLRLLG
jgi:hypothetical protein